MSELLRIHTESYQPSVSLAREYFDRDMSEQQAHELLVLRQKHEFLPMQSEGHNNAVTALFEEMTAAGDLSIVRFDGDQSIVHRDTLARLLNGYNETAPHWEKRRRYAEIVEELEVHQTFLKIAAGDLPEDTLFITISDAPDDAANEREANLIGYRMGNHKGMLRSYHFERQADGSWVRVLEQLSRSNTHDSSTRQWFNQHAAVVPLHATGALHETIISDRKRFPDGVVSLMQELDGPEKIYGEPWAEAARNKRPSYSLIREVSERRRSELARFTEELSRHEEALLDLLQSGSIDYQEKLRRYYEKQDEVIDRIAIMDSDFARDARGEETVKYYQQAGFALHRGDKEAFKINMHTVRRIIEKDPTAGGTACGGKGARRINPDNSDAFDEYSTDLFEKSSDDADSWEWKDGVCRVPSCGYKGKVGPCSICEKCQKRFDAGEDPTKDPVPYTTAENGKQKGWFSWMVPNPQL